MQPAAAAATDPALVAAPAEERSAYLRAYGRRSWLGLGIVMSSFAACLLVLGVGGEGGGEEGGARSGNPLRSLRR